MDVWGVPRLLAMHHGPVFGMLDYMFYKANPYHSAPLIEANLILPRGGWTFRKFPGTSSFVSYSLETSEP